MSMENIAGKNRPVATNFQFLKISCPFGTASCWGVPAPNPAQLLGRFQEWISSIEALALLLSVSDFADSYTLLYQSTASLRFPFRL